MVEPKLCLDSFSHAYPFSLSQQSLTGSIFLRLRPLLEPESLTEFDFLMLAHCLRNRHHRRWFSRLNTTTAYLLLEGSQQIQNIGAGVKYNNIAILYCTLLGRYIYGGVR